MVRRAAKSDRRSFDSPSPSSAEADSGSGSLRMTNLKKALRMTNLKRSLRKCRSFDSSATANSLRMTNC